MTTFLPLGDQAALAYFPDESAALHFAALVRQANDPWLVDVVAAYTSVAVFFDLDRVNFAGVAERLGEIGIRDQGSGIRSQESGVRSQEFSRESQTSAVREEVGRRQRIPCCYEFQLDLARVAEHTGLSAEEVIRLHGETEYTVYAIGFCPGFPYLGYLPKSLCGVPRLAKPRVKVEAGSVGLTGRQTGIYPEARPGGWNLIGRTPLALVNVADGYFPLRTGDQVRFARIDEAEFRRLEGQRL